MGGIPDQIEDGVTGILLRDPENLGAFAAAFEQLILDPTWARQLGMAAHDSVRGQFLGLQTLLRYGYLLEQMLDREDVHELAASDGHAAFPGDH